MYQQADDIKIINPILINSLLISIIAKYNVQGRI